MTMQPEIDRIVELMKPHRDYATGRAEIDRLAQAAIEQLGDSAPARELAHRLIPPCRGFMVGRKTEREQDSQETPPA